ncbi:MAG: SLC13 family permease [Candidatus Promineifilaceae bacterium]|nr:SLC13 family permease [Candidatus Promineifilaceae bacterium]
MSARWRPRLLLGLVALATLLLVRSGAGWAQGEEQGGAGNRHLLIGHVYDGKGQPVAGVDVTARTAGESELLAEAETQDDGRFALSFGPDVASLAALQIQLQRPHFQDTSVRLPSETLAALQSGDATVMADVELVPRITPAFWLAAAIFVLMLILIAVGSIHNTLAALVGAALIFAVSYLGPLVTEDLFIFDFARALRYVDWNVIFLIMGMMIVIAVVERTGIFQWAAFMAYKLSRGKGWLLMIILMIIAGVASAFLDNVTTMLLMTPITIQIALSLNLNPLALLMPEVMASNVVGISTLIGTPTNILIGSFAGISFSDFVVNLTPGVVIAMVGLVLYNQVVYGEELQSSAAKGALSPMLLERLEKRGEIKQPGHLRKAGVVGAAMLVLFVLGENFHLVPAVTALMGATALLMWIRPDIEEMIEAVDWTTLVFFIALFIAVGAVREVGLISLLATGIGRLVGENLLLATMVVAWLSAILSTIVANIPFTAAMLPVIASLTATIPGAESKVLFYALSVGAAMGGNGSLIGASANMVTAGIAERAGSPITYGYFLKRGFPALIVTVALASIWLYIRFL